MAQTRHRRTDRELFLSTLSDLSKGTSAIISGSALRRHLRWEKDKYKRVKDQLLKEGAVKSGQARGGGIGLITPNSQSRGLKAFVSYCHVDDGLKNELLKHLEPLRIMGFIDVWHDGKITPGKPWEKEIFDQLRSANIILLLVSIDFITSPFCNDVELKEALQRHHSGKSRVIPIILRSCLWRSTQMAELLALPKDAAPVIGGWPDKDLAFTNVAEGVQKAAKEILGVQ